MKTVKQSKAKRSERELIFTRIIRAPRPQVFNAWTDPSRILEWWGPYGCTSIAERVDVSPGGIWEFTMHGPDKKDYPLCLCFQEVDPPSWLAYTQHAGVGEQASLLVTVKFDIERKHTRLTMRAIYPSTALRDQAVHEFGAIESGRQSLDRLEDFLEKETREALR